MNMLAGVWLFRRAAAALPACRGRVGGDRRLVLTVSVAAVPWVALFLALSLRFTL